MKNPIILPVWASRVKAYRIRRLYESDAQGRLDLELLDDVGWDLYARCDSFLLANQASKGRVRCPVCGAIITHSMQAKEILHCPACAWQCPLKDYLNTIKNQQLDGGPEVIELFQQYIDAFPKAKEPTEKMVLIDQLIHGFHHFLRSGRTRRPVGINLIDGHIEFVVDFLDHLSYGPASTPGLQETQEQWQENIHRPARKRRAAR